MGSTENLFEVYPTNLYIGSKSKYAQCTVEVRTKDGKTVQGVPRNMTFNK